MNSNNKWADLPVELLQLIGKHLKSRIDVFRFRAVCTSWRSVVPLSYHQSQPSLSLPQPFRATALLSSATICRLEHQSGDAACLVKVIQSSSGEMLLLNPLSFEPQLNKIPPGNINNNDIRKTLNLLDFRLIELTKCYSLNFTSKPFKNVLKKVLLFNECGVLTLSHTGFLRYLGFGDKTWTNIGKHGTYCDDIIVYKDQFYVIDNLGIVSWIDKSMNLVQYAPPHCGLGQMKNLVESEGFLYVVDSYLEEEVSVGHATLQQQGIGRRNWDRLCRVDIKVYKLDEDWGTWVNVTSLGDRVFVLSKEVCFSISVRNFPGCQGNCIYFIDPMSEDPFVRGGLQRFAGRVFWFDSGSIKKVESFPAYKRLFSPYMSLPFATSASGLPHNRLFKT